MLGAIIGDICGSTYEFQPAKGYDFELYNEESTFTICVHCISLL